MFSENIIMYTTSNTPKTARTIGKRGYRKKSYLFFSQKCGLEFWAESLIELYAAYAAELNFFIMSYLCQPMIFELKTGRRFKNRDEAKAALLGLIPISEMEFYTPDLLIKRVGKQIIQECKPAKKVQEFSDKAKLIEKACLANGFEFQIITDEDVFEEPYQTNVKTLISLLPHLPYWNRQEAEKKFKMAIELFGDVASIAEISNSLQISPFEILIAAVKGLVGLDCRHQLLTPTSQVLLRKNGIIGLI